MADGVLWMNFGTKNVFWALGLGLGAFWVSCTTTQKELPPPMPPPEPPPYTRVSHPVGNDIGDVIVIFYKPESPDRKTLTDCDKDFRDLLSKTQVAEEIKQAANEFVKEDPVSYHWCFYSKVLDVEEGVQKQPFLFERQKVVVEGYEFITPIAKAFYREYRDSRYWRWAIEYYKHLSEFVFDERVNTTETTKQELVTGVPSFYGWRAPQEASKSEDRVIEKYGLRKPEDINAQTQAQGEPLGAGVTSADSIPAQVDSNKGSVKKPGSSAKKRAPAAAAKPANKPAEESNDDALFEEEEL